MGAIARRLASALATVGAAWFAWTLAGDLYLAAFSGLSWGVAVVLTLRLHALYPTLAASDGWADARWTVLAVVVVVAATLLGLGPDLGIEPQVRAGIGVLVLGVATTTYAAAMVSAGERLDATDRGEETADQA